MYDRELRGIEETAAVEPASGNKVSPFRPAIRQVEIRVGRPERTIRVRKRAGRSRNPLARAGRDVDYNAGLLAVFRGRRARDDLQGLHRVQRNLVGEDFALLVCDWLAIHGKRILR